MTNKNYTLGKKKTYRGLQAPIQEKLNNGIKQFLGKA